MSADAVNPTAALVIDLDSSPADRKLKEFETRLGEASTRLNGMVLKPEMDLTHFNAQISKARDDGGVNRVVSVSAKLSKAAGENLQEQVKQAVRGTKLEAADWAGVTTTLGEAVSKTLGQQHSVGLNSTLLTEEITKAARLGLQNLSATMTVTQKVEGEHLPKEIQQAATITLNKGGFWEEIQRQAAAHPISLSVNTSTLHAKLVEELEQPFTILVRTDKGNLAVSYDAIHASVAAALREHAVSISDESLASLKTRVHEAAKGGIAGIGAIFTRIDEKMLKIRATLADDLEALLKLEKKSGKGGGTRTGPEVPVSVDPGKLNTSVANALNGVTHTVLVNYGAVEQGVKDALTRGFSVTHEVLASTAQLKQQIESVLGSHVFTVNLGTGNLKERVEQAVQAGAAAPVPVAPPAVPQPQADLARRSILQERVPPAQGRLDLEETGDGVPTRSAAKASKRISYKGDDGYTYSVSYAQPSAAVRERAEAKRDENLIEKAKKDDEKKALQRVKGAAASVKLDLIAADAALKRVQAEEAAEAAASARAQSDRERVIQSAARGRQLESERKAGQMAKGFSRAEDAQRAWDARGAETAALYEASQEASRRAQLEQDEKTLRDRAARTAQQAAKKDARLRGSATVDDLTKMRRFLADAELAQRYLADPRLGEEAALASFGSAATNLGRNKERLDAAIASWQSSMDRVKGIRRDDAAEAARVRQAVAKDASLAGTVDFDAEAGGKALLRQAAKARRFLADDRVQGDRESLARSRYTSAAVDLAQSGELDARMKQFREEQAAARVQRREQAKAQRDAARAPIEAERFQTRTIFASGVAKGQGYTSIGKQILGAQAVDEAFGRAEAERRLGSKKSLLEEIKNLASHKSATTEARAEMERFRSMMNDTHSAARGLAGSLGQIWLTWGSTVPLVMFASMGAALRGVYTEGKAVEYQLNMIKGISGEALSMGDVDKVVQGTMFTPTQAVEGLRALAQSGLSAKDALSALPDVMALATVGETDLGTAAFAATGVMKAFNLTATEMGRVSDVMAKASAMSNASVTDMMEAFKYASPASSLYGETLEETGAAIAMLSEKNIKGSMAGVAHMNMLREIYTPTKKASEAFHELGINVQDMQRRGLTSIEMLDEIRQKTSQLDATSLREFTQAIGGERGSRELAPLLTAGTKKLKDFQQDLEDSSGFTRKVLLELQDSVEAAQARLKQALISGFTEAFGENRSTLQAFLNDLAAIARGETFKGFVKGLTEGVVNLTRFLIDHGSAVKTVAVAYTGLKVLDLAVNSLALMASRTTQHSLALKENAAAAKLSWAAMWGKAGADTAATAAATGAAVATAGSTGATNTDTVSKVTNTAATTAFGRAQQLATASTVVLGSALRVAIGVLNPVLLVVTGVATAWQLLAARRDEDREAQLRHENSTNVLLDSLKREKERLEEVNEQMQRRIDLRREGKDPDDNSQAVTSGGKLAAQQGLVAQLEERAARARQAMERAGQDPQGRGLGEAIRASVKANEELQAARGTLKEIQTLTSQVQERSRGASTATANVGMAKLMTTAREELEARRESVLRGGSTKTSTRQLREIQAALENLDRLDTEEVRNSLESTSSARYRGFVKVVDQLRSQGAVAQSFEDKSDEKTKKQLEAARARRDVLKFEVDLLKERLRTQVSSTKVEEDLLKARFVSGSLSEWEYEDSLTDGQKKGLRLKELAAQGELDRQGSFLTRTLSTTVVNRANTSGKTLKQLLDEELGEVEAESDRLGTTDREGAILTRVSSLVNPALATTEEARKQVARDVLETYRSINEANGEISSLRAQLALVDAERRARASRRGAKLAGETEARNDQIDSSLSTIRKMERKAGEPDATLYPLEAARAKAKGTLAEIQESYKKGKEAAEALQTVYAARELTLGFSALEMENDADQIEVKAASTSNRAEAEELRAQARDLRARAEEARGQAEVARSVLKATDTRLHELNTESVAARRRTLERADDSVVQDFLKKDVPVGRSRNPVVQSAVGSAQALEHSVKLYKSYLDAIEAAIGKEEELNRVRARGAMLAVSSVSSAAAALKGFVKEGSKDYARLTKMEESFRTLQAALTLQDSARKLAEMTKVFTVKAALSEKEETRELLSAWMVAENQQAADGTMLASNTALKAGEANNSMFSALAKVPEVFMSFMASMGPVGYAAAGVAIAAVLGGSFGGKGGHKGTVNEGKGTVLGSPDKASESLTKGIDRLSKYQEEGLVHSTGMLRSLRSIESNIGGVVAFMARTGALSSGGLDVRTGYGTSTLGSTWDSLARSAGAGTGRVLSGGLLAGLGPLGPLTGGLVGASLGKLTNTLFGSKTKVDARGLMAGPQSMESILAGGFQAQLFADITTKKKTFGFTTSTKRDTKTEDLDVSAEAQLTKVFANAGRAITDAAKALGLPLSAVSSKINSFVVDLQKVNLKGLDAEEQVKKIQEVLGQQLDLLSKAAIEGLDEFQLVDEGYLETVIRVAGGYEQAEASLRRLGLAVVDLKDVSDKTVEDIGAQTVKDSIVNAEVIKTLLTTRQVVETEQRLVRDAGWVDRNGNFSEQRRLGTVRVDALYEQVSVAKTVTDTEQVLSGIGRIVENLSGTAEDIADSYRSLLDVRVAFNAMGLSASAITPAMVEGASSVDELASAVNSYVDNILEEPEQLKVKYAQLQDQMRRLGYTSVPKTKEEFKALVNGIDTTTEAGQALLIQTMSLSDGFSEMVDAMKELGGGIEEEIKRIRKMLASDAANSYEAYQAKFAVTTAKARSGDQQAIEDLAEASSDYLGAAEDRVASALELARIRASVATSLQTTLDLVRSVASASSTSDAATAAVAAQTAIEQARMTIQPVDQVDAFASGGFHAGGWRIVGEDGPELEATGPSRIYNARETAEILSGGRIEEAETTPAVMGALLAEISALREEVAALRRDGQTGQGSLAEMARILRRVTPGGNALAVQSAG